jgi:hypothetical protein
MPGATTELNLATAVDSDDNADYLTLSLANSLRTVDALFNNLTGHNHGGAHQGAAVAPAAIPGGSITNAQLGPDVARANLLTNGGFEIWQRGNGPFTNDGGYSADRWYLSGTSMTVSRVASPVDTLGRYAASVAVAGSNPIQYFAQLTEDVSQLRGKTVSFSIRVSSTVANKIRAYYVDTVEAWSSYHTGGGTWQTLTITRTVPPGATGLIVGVTIDAGAPGTYYLDNAMLVVGSQPADYAPLHPADDLARCFRYYETMGGTFADENIGLLWCYAASGGAFPLRWKVRKAVSPTMTINGSWRVQYGAGAFTAGSLGLGSASVDNANAAISGATGLTVGQVAAVSGQNPTTSFVTIEANP